MCGRSNKATLPSSCPGSLSYFSKLKASYHHHHHFPIAFSFFFFFFLFPMNLWISYYYTWLLLSPLWLHPGKLNSGQFIELPASQVSCGAVWISQLFFPLGTSGCKFSLDPVWTGLQVMLQHAIETCKHMPTTEHMLLLIVWRHFDFHSFFYKSNSSLFRNRREFCLSSSVDPRSKLFST